MGILISVDELAASIRRAPAPVVLDVRWHLGRDDGQAQYHDGHVPGAIYVDLDDDLASPPAREHGRHPLPEVDVLQGKARSWGIRTGVEVVVYDDDGGMSAARAWWLLRWTGIDTVRILDGGLSAWLRAGHAVAQGPGNLPRHGDVVLVAGHLPVIDSEDAAGWPHRGPLLDVRMAARYRGEIEPMDTQAGHIPGAISAPGTELVTDEGFFREPAALRAHFAALGVDDGTQTAVYCGSGVHAAHTVAALEIAGLPGATIYAGGWSKWSGDPRRRVARGAECGVPALP